MSLVPRLFRRPEATTTDSGDHPRTEVLHDAPMAARITPCPADRAMAILVVLDGTSVPAPQHYRVWMDALARRGYRAIRTGALTARQGALAEQAGLVCAQELVLLEMLGRPERQGVVAEHVAVRTRRMTSADLGPAAVIDRAAFGERWWLNEPIIADICTATPRYRARIAENARGAMQGFLISGRAGNVGYIQRLAVDPAQHRKGVGTALLDDAFTWMRRAGVNRVYVNTHDDNTAALALYRRVGFHDLSEPLRVYEGTVGT